MGMFCRDNDNKIYFRTEPRERILDRNDALKIIESLNKDNPEHAWIVDAVEAYLDICDYFSSQSDARVVLTSYGSPALKFDIIVDFIQGVDISYDSKLTKAIMRSEAFWIRSSVLRGCISLDFVFIMDTNANVPIDSDKKVYLALLEEIINNLDDAFGWSEMAEARIDADALGDLATTALLSRDCGGGISMISASYLRLVYTICKLLSRITYCAEGCPGPEFTVACRNEILRLSVRVEEIETDEIKQWLPALLNSVSNVQIIHTGGTVDMVRMSQNEGEIGYLAFDVNIDIPTPN